MDLLVGKGCGDFRLDNKIYSAYSENEEMR